MGSERQGAKIGHSIIWKLFKLLGRRFEAKIAKLVVDLSSAFFSGRFDSSLLVSANLEVIPRT